MSRVKPQTLDLFDRLPWSLPDGFKYHHELLSAREGRDLVEKVRKLPFKEFEFHGFLGKRRVVSFGWRYDFSRGGLQPTEEMPAFLVGARDNAARFADLDAQELKQILVTEYPAGSTIGWHRDRDVFGDVVGLSLLSGCMFRFRRKSGSKWQRSSLVLNRRSCYLLSGPARTEWQHSIPGGRRAALFDQVQNAEIARCERIDSCALRKAFASQCTWLAGY